MDQYETTKIQISASAVDLGIDIDLAKYQGPFPNLLHQKQSYMCAKILIQTKEQVTELIHKLLTCAQNKRKLTL